jgi:hypothetical protein
MGRRSRKRAALPAEPAPRRAPRADERAPERPRAATGRRGAKREPPPAPWGKFPLVELCVLVAFIVGIIGFVTWGQTGKVLVAFGAALGSLAGLELAVREHFAGYKSHSTLLAGTVAVLALAVLFVVRAPQQVNLLVAAIVFASAFYLLRELFKRRSGGFGFR